MELSDTILVSGHRGLAGRAIVRNLLLKGYRNLKLLSRQELDLTSQEAVSRFFGLHRIDYVFLAAGKVGGVLANQRFPLDFLQENLLIASNVIRYSAEHGVKKLVYLGSSCIYPRLSVQPIHEESLLTGPLEPTNEGYAIAKIAGIKLCEFYRKQYGKNFVSVMPTNMYGIGDRFHPQDSHVIPALLLRFHTAKQQRDSHVRIWGTGNARREFLFSDDFAEATFRVMQSYEGNVPLNIGTGEDCSILELAELIREVVGFQGQLLWDPSKPEGVAQKRLDVSRIQNLDWRPQISLREGLERVYRWARHSGKFGASHNAMTPHKKLRSIEVPKTVAPVPATIPPGSAHVDLI